MKSEFQQPHGRQKYADFLTICRNRLTNGKGILNSFSPSPIVTRTISRALGFLERLEALMLNDNNLEGR